MRARAPARAGERAVFFGLEAEVLAHSARGDGRHWVLKVERGGRPVVLKLYGRKRDRLRDFLRDLGHRFLVGKTGMTPAARMRTERDALELWRRHGFAVPRVLDVELPREVPPLRLVLEWVDGRTLKRLLADPAVPIEEKRRLVARCARDWSRRHDLAIELREPRLLQAHASFAHVLVADDALVTIDFEVGWLRPDVERLVSLELASFLSFGPRLPAAQADALLDAVVESYSPRERLALAVRDAPRGPYPFPAWLARSLSGRAAGSRSPLDRLSAALARTLA